MDRLLCVRHTPVADHTCQGGIPSERSDPHSASDFKSYPLSSYLFLVFCAAGLWNEIEQAGITDIQGVWLAEWGCVFSGDFDQATYGGHARQAAHIALGAREGGYLGRFVVLVDDDIDLRIWPMSCGPCPLGAIRDHHRDRDKPLEHSIDPRLSPGQKGGRFYQLMGDS